MSFVIYWSLKSSISLEEFRIYQSEQAMKKLKNYKIEGVALKVHSKEECKEKLRSIVPTNGLTEIILSDTQCFSDRICPGLYTIGRKQAVCYSYAKVDL